MLGKLIGSALTGLGARWRRLPEPAIAARLAEARGLQKEGQTGLALAIYQEILRGQPQDVAALSACGDALCAFHRYDEALGVYESALSKQSRNRELLFKLGNLYWLTGRVADAEDCFNQILCIYPDDSRALNNLGLVRQDEGDPVQAERFFRAALASDPAYADAGSNLLLCLNYRDGCSLANIYREHTAWTERFVTNFAPRAPGDFAHVHTKLRVGYLSPNLMTHSVAYFLEPLLKHHDASSFEIFCYDDANRPDAVTARLRALSAHWRVVAGVSDDEAESMIRRDEIDILVELAGHTADNRLRLLARRVAPVQVTYLGYPNTTGIPAIDYRITDSVADPPGIADSYHSEILARLPLAWCYLPPQDAPPIVERSTDAGGATFGSFNKIAKLSDRAIAIWARVLSAVPGSSLLLKSKSLNDPGVAERTRQRFVASGIAPERVRTAGFAPTNRSHMAQYGEVDIALDTFPYCGTTTTCEALYMGVPVITLCGPNHVARVGAALLSALGRTEWIADSEDRFVAIACALAKDRPRLAQLRRGLRGEMQSSPLLDGASFTRVLEESYRQFHTRAKSTMAPDLDRR